MMPPTLKKRILYICGSTNQTTQMHQIAAELPGYEHFFTPYYDDGFLDRLRRLHLLEFSILGNRMLRRCLSYLHAHDLNVDFQGREHTYDLVLTCSDLVIPGNIRRNRVILVQEGMTDPENFLYRLYRFLPILPRWIASTASTGLSDQYEIFCVASEGYREMFARKGVRPEKLVVTGIPNFDNCARYLQNSFPHRNYVLVCTSDTRETFKWENRKRFIRQAIHIAAGRRLIFKLHPNENARRATQEIHRLAPNALVFSAGVAEEMIANCDVLITKFSSVVYVGLALGKEVYSGFDLEALKRLTPVQNASAARNIAALCRKLLGDGPDPPVTASADDTPARGAEHSMVPRVRTGPP